MRNQDATSGRELEGLWPYHPKPLPGEIFSSWLKRTALGHCDKLHTFCHAHWPGMQIWNRDVDKAPSDALIFDMSAGTGTDITHARATLLSSLNGSVFEAGDSNTNPHWILRLGVWHRSRKAFGQQFCPLCLAQDPYPYFRLNWRLAWTTCCTHHGCMLHDCCEDCGQPIIPHRREEPRCYNCGYDLTKANFQPAHPLAARLQIQLSNVLLGGNFAPFGHEAAHSLAVFGSVRQIAKILASGVRSRDLREVVLCHLPSSFTTVPIVYSDNINKSELELMRVNQRHAIMALTARCLEGWPFMFAAYCAESRNWWSWVMKDSDRRALPFQFHDAARRYLLCDQ